MTPSPRMYLVALTLAASVIGQWDFDWFLQESPHCEIRVDPVAEFLYVGHELKLTCDVRCAGSGTFPDLQWYGIDDLPVAQSTEGRYSLIRYGKRHLKLRIEMVTLLDSGIYTCRGLINGDWKKASTYVIVEEHPDFIPFLITKKKRFRTRSQTSIQLPTLSARSTISTNGHVTANQKPSKTSAKTRSKFKGATLTVEDTERMAVSTQTALSSSMTNTRESTAAHFFTPTPLRSTTDTINPGYKTTHTPHTHSTLKTATRKLISLIDTRDLISAPSENTPTAMPKAIATSEKTGFYGPDKFSYTQKYAIKTIPIHTFASETNSKSNRTTKTILRSNHKPAKFSTATIETYTASKSTYTRQSTASVVSKESLTTWFTDIPQANKKLENRELQHTIRNPTRKYDSNNAATTYTKVRKSKVEPVFKYNTKTEQTQNTITNTRTNSTTRFMTFPNTSNIPQKTSNQIIGAPLPFSTIVGKSDKQAQVTVNSLSKHGAKTSNTETSAHFNSEWKTNQFAFVTTKSRSFNKTYGSASTISKRQIPNLSGAPTPGVHMTQRARQTTDQTTSIGKAYRANKKEDHNAVTSSYKTEIVDDSVNYQKYSDFSRDNRDHSHVTETPQKDIRPGFYVPVETSTSHGEIIGYGLSMKKSSSEKSLSFVAKNHTSTVRDIYQYFSSQSPSVSTAKPSSNVDIRKGETGNSDVDIARGVNKVTVKTTADSVGDFYGDTDAKKTTGTSYTDHKIKTDAVVNGGFASVAHSSDAIYLSSTVSSEMENRDIEAPYSRAGMNKSHKSHDFRTDGAPTTSADYEKNGAIMSMTDKNIVRHLLRGNNPAKFDRNLRRVNKECVACKFYGLGKGIESGPDGTSKSDAKTLAPSREEAKISDGTDAKKPNKITPTSREKKRDQSTKSYRNMASESHIELSTPGAVRPTQRDASGKLLITKTTGHATGRGVTFGFYQSVISTQAPRAVVTPNSSSMKSINNTVPALAEDIIGDAHETSIGNPTFLVEKTYRSENYMTRTEPTNALDSYSYTQPERSTRPLYVSPTSNTARYVSVHGPATSTQSEIITLHDLVNKTTRVSPSLSVAGKSDSLSVRRTRNGSLVRSRAVSKTALAVAAPTVVRKHVEFNNPTEFIRPNDSSKDWPVDKHARRTAASTTPEKLSGTLNGSSALPVATESSEQADRVSARGGVGLSSSREHNRSAVAWSHTLVRKRALLHARIEKVKRHAVSRTAELPKRKTHVYRVMKFAQKRSHTKKFSFGRTKRSAAMDSTGEYSGPLMMNHTYGGVTPGVIIAERDHCSGFGPTATVTVIILGVVVLLLLYLVALLFCLRKFYRKSQFRLRQQDAVIEKDIEANDDHVIEDRVDPAAKVVAVVVETEDENPDSKCSEDIPKTSEVHPPPNDYREHAQRDATENHAHVIVEPLDNDVDNDNLQHSPENLEDDTARNACDPPEDTEFESDVAVEGSDDDRIDISAHSRDESDEERLDQSVIPATPCETEIDPPTEHVSEEHKPHAPGPPTDTPAIVRESGDIEEDFSASMSDGADYSDQEPYPELHGTIPLQPTHYVHEPPQYDIDEHDHEHDPEQRTNPPIIHQDSDSPPPPRRHYDNDAIVAPITPDRPYPESYDYDIPDMPPAVPDLPPPLPDINGKLHHPDVAPYDDLSHHNGGEFYDDRNDAMNCVEADVHSNTDYVNTGYTNQVYDGEYPYAPQYHPQPHEGHQ